MMKISVFAGVAVAALTAIGALGGCHKQASSPADSHTVAKKHLAAIDIPTLFVSSQRVVLPAVPGHPAAAYFHLENHQNSCVLLPCSGGKTPPLTVLSVTVEGAQQSMMHESRGNTMVDLDHITLAPGQSVDFAPGGKHLMVFGLSPKLGAGKTTLIRFKLSNGDSIAAPAKIEAAGGGADSMAGMKM